MVARADNMYLKKEKHSNANNAHANIDMNLFTENAHNRTYQVPHSELLNQDPELATCALGKKDELLKVSSFV